MTEVSQQEHNDLILKHHQSECKTKEAADNQFDEKVKYRAYEIWLETHRSDERTNYFQAMEEIRELFCDCSDFARQYIIVEHKMAHASNNQLTQEKITEINEVEEEQKQNEDEHCNLKTQEEEEPINDTLPSYNEQINQQDEKLPSLTEQINQQDEKLPSLTEQINKQEENLPSLTEQINQPQTKIKEIIEEPKPSEEEFQFKDISSEENLPSLMKQISEKESKQQETLVEDENTQNKENVETPQNKVEESLPSLMDQINESEAATENTVPDEFKPTQTSNERLPLYDEKIEYKEEKAEEQVGEGKSKKKRKGKK